MIVVEHTIQKIVDTIPSIQINASLNTKPKFHCFTTIDQKSNSRS